MGVLAEMLEKAKSDGSVKLSELRTTFGTERTALEEANAASMGDWMNAKDLLAGATAAEKMADFQCRQKELSDTQRYILDNDIAMARLAELGGVMPERKFAGGDPVKVEVVGPSRKTLGALAHESGKFADYDFKGTKEFATRTEDIIHQLKAVSYTGLPGGDQQNTVGLLPTDRIIPIYPMQLEPLDYFTIRAEPGGYIRYVEPELPYRPTSTDGNSQYDDASGRTVDRSGATATTNIDIDQAYETIRGARIRIRGSRLGERIITRPTVSLPKQSEGIMTFVNREDINDNPMIWQRTADQLMLDVRQLLMWQLFYGNGTFAHGNTPSTGAWNGIDGNLGRAAVNTGDVYLRHPSEVATDLDMFNQDNKWHNQVPVTTLANGRDEPLAWLEELYVRMRYVGMNPTAIMLGAPDWTRIRQSQRSYRYQNPDFLRYPNGEIQGIPMVVNPFARANELYVFDTRPDVVEIVLGEEIQNDVSEDFDFGNNRTTMRVVVYGNIPIYKRFGLVKVTATNLFMPQTSP